MRIQARGEGAKVFVRVFWATVFSMVALTIVLTFMAVWSLFSHSILPLLGFYPRRPALFFLPNPYVEEDSWWCTGEQPRRELFRIFEARVFAYQLLLFAFVLWLIYLFVRSVSLESLVIPLGTVLALVLLAVVLAGAILMTKAAWRSEGWALIREYFRAVKQRACPLVTYSGEKPVTGAYDS